MSRQPSGFLNKRAKVFPPVAKRTAGAAFHRRTPCSVPVHGVLPQTLRIQTFFPLTSAFKSYGFSIFVHATLVVALYALPMSASKRFASSGAPQVIALDAVQSSPTPIAQVAIEPPETLVRLEDVVDRLVETEPMDASVERDLPMSDRADLPRLRRPMVQHLNQALEPVKLQRRINDRPTPTIELTKTPPRPEYKRTAVPPPAAASVPTQPLSGFDSPTADLSSNPPPAYPLKAVQRKLEGVVLLRLEVSQTGSVSRVELIESSGHPILDQAAIDSVALWQGEPATRWGRPISSVETLPIRFRL